MFDKLKNLIANNHIRELLGGKLVLTQDVVNRFMGKWPPQGIDRVELVFQEDGIRAEVEGELAGQVPFFLQCSIALGGLQVNKEEQVARVAPAGDIEFRTEHQKMQFSFQEGAGLIRELEALAGLAPPEVREALVFEDEHVKVLLHLVPGFSAEFAKFLEKLPVLSTLGVNLLDWVEITDVKPGKQTLAFETRRV